MDKAHALLELRLLVLARRGIERALEIVEHREELLDQPLGRHPRPALACSRADALAVVVELGLEPLQRVEVRVALAAYRLEHNLLWRQTSLAASSTKVSRYADPSPASPSSSSITS